ncbi:MAG: helicase-related protein [Nanoarchaeota archaeon]|nr:helicase-related protein [Nanoarchaeota archaeon]
MVDPNNSNFITNEKGDTLYSRLDSLIKNTKAFDCLVGYFFSSGFYRLCDYLKSPEKVRILIGLNTDKGVAELIKKAGSQNNLSDLQVKEVYDENLIEDFNNHAPETKKIEDASDLFIEWIKSKKLEIKVYRSQNIHAKVYIMSFNKNQVDPGRVITGSSNLTKAGLEDNLEFNVVLKDNRDYKFALDKFNELWKDSVEVSDLFAVSIKSKTWLNESLSPYELYLKFLYEYFGERIEEEEFDDDSTGNALKLKYQEEAVRDAKSKLKKYGGVFISDVVGLGKTYIVAKLLKNLIKENPKERILILAPPAIIDRNNPGSWERILSEYGVSAVCRSTGILDKVLKQDLEDKTIIVIDEAHRFRTEETGQYEALHKICKGNKKIILVTATPLNNYPRDVLNQIKLFQNIKDSDIPHVKNLEKFFNDLQKKIQIAKKSEDKNEYIKVIKDVSKQIRDKVLKPLIVRRTRAEILDHFKEDLDKAKVKFPKIAEPQAVLYGLSKEEEKIFDETIKLIAQDFEYIRYTPLLYINKNKLTITQEQEISQKNMRKFMKILLVKRLESSFEAFKKSIGRFIEAYDDFISVYKDKKKVPISKKYSGKYFDYVEEGNDDAIIRLKEDGKLEEYNASDFKPEFIKGLIKDREILERIKKMWEKIKRDPKLEKFKLSLKTDNILKKNKILVFTESTETAYYLHDNLPEEIKKRALVFTGESNESEKNNVIKNFDENSREQNEDYDILICTEVLAEGVNLNRANVVINYDIPWNPVRVIQRVGRINRISTKFKEIYTYSFFPTAQSENQIRLKETAISKVNAFIQMLGNDSKLLTEDEEVAQHGLFEILTSKKYIEGEESYGESELDYLEEIRLVKRNNPKLFNKIKNLPRKARTGKKYSLEKSSVLTFFKKGELQKWILSDKLLTNSELDFFESAKFLKSSVNEEGIPKGQDFYDLLEKNKQKFEECTKEQIVEFEGKGGRDLSTNVFRIIEHVMNSSQLTDENKLFLKKVQDSLKKGGIDRNSLKKFLSKIKKGSIVPERILELAKQEIDPQSLQKTYSENIRVSDRPREVILSVYLRGEKDGTTKN